MRYSLLLSASLAVGGPSVCLAAVQDTLPLRDSLVTTLFEAWQEPLPSLPKLFLSIASGSRYLSDHDCLATNVVRRPPNQFTSTFASVRVDIVGRTVCSVKGEYYPGTVKRAWHVTTLVSLSQLSEPMRITIVNGADSTLLDVRATNDPGWVTTVLSPSARIRAPAAIGRVERSELQVVCDDGNLGGGLCTSLLRLIPSKAHLSVMPRRRASPLSDRPALPPYEELPLAPSPRVAIYDDISMLMLDSLVRFAEQATTLFSTRDAGLQLQLTSAKGVRYICHAGICENIGPLGSFYNAGLPVLMVDADGSPR